LDLLVKHTRHKILILVCLWAVVFLPLATRAQVIITQQPQSQAAPRGAKVTLTVQATGNGPLTFQWRVNGINIPGANSPAFIIASFQTADAGDYTVAVGDSTGAINSAVARIRPLGLDALPFSDDMNGNNRVSGLAGTGSGNNLGATKEPGEPNHANKPGTNSVWLTWSPGLLGGVATFDLAGSSFDTLLAVYTGNNVTNLTLVAANDDVSDCDDPASGYHTSRVRFNAKAGTVYHIAVDGLEGAAGDIVLKWDVNVLEGLLSILNILPTVSVGLPGDTLDLSVTIQQGGGLLGYQWFLNCNPVPGATQGILHLNNLQPANVGDYAVHVTQLLTGVETVSDRANIQINIVDGRSVGISALDKFPEIADGVKSSLAGSASRLQKAGGGRLPVHKSSGGPARGYRGTQVFSTVGATKDPGEPNHCGEPGGASEWYAYQAPATGLLVLDTDGSDFDTVLAVYTGPGTDFQSLVSVACDNNSGSNGKTSRVLFPVVKDTVYYVAVDGVGGASGTVQLEYTLGVAPVITQQPATQTVSPGASVTLTVLASGIPSPDYSWLFCDGAVCGATNTSLTITNFQAANEGTYSVVVSNFAEAVVSDTATLLLDSPLRLDSFNINSNRCNLRIVGQRDGNYVVQSSTNLVDWNPIATNTAPTGIWDFVVTNAAACPYCFYRALSQ
jgi:hypothetical protein